MNCATNIITANFSGGKTTATTAALWQWDYGQVLCITGIEDLPAAFEVHFSTNRAGGVSTVAVGADGQVTIPNVLLTIGKNLNAWIYLSDSEGDGETEYAITIPVKARPMPETYDAEATGVFDDVVRQVSEYAQTAQTAADNAGASATAAAGGANAAATSADSAAESAAAAERARDDAVTAKGQAETAAQTATQKAQQSAQNASQAASDAGRAESAAERAETAETGAEAAKTAAETAAQGAAASASAASASATSAGQAATSAAQSASAAAGSATTAQGAAQTATTKAGEASASATAAAASETAAQTAQAAAETAETNAGQSASTATAKAAEAAQSASGAAQSKTDAEAAATRAEQAAATLTVDSALSDSSANPVENRVITAEVTQVKSHLNENTNGLISSLGDVVLDESKTETYSSNNQKYFPCAFVNGHIYRLRIDFTSVVMPKVRLYLATATTTTARPQYLGEYYISSGETLEKIFTATTDASYLNMTCYAATGENTYTVKVEDIPDIPLIDDTLTQSGKVADAKAVGDQIVNIKNGLLRTVIDENDTFTPSSAEAKNHFFAEGFKAGAEYDLTLKINHAYLSGGSGGGINVRLATGASASYFVQTVKRFTDVVDGDEVSVHFKAIVDANYLALTYYLLDTSEIDVDILLNRYDNYSKDVDVLYAEDNAIKENLIKHTVGERHVEGAITNNLRSTVGGVFNNGFGGKYTFIVTVTQASEPLQIGMRCYGMSNAGVYNGGNKSGLVTGDIIKFELNESDVPATTLSAGIIIFAASTDATQIVDLKVIYTAVYADISGKLYQTALRQKHGRMEFGAHRGARSYAPPDSIAAYRIAGELGFDWAWIAQIKHSADGTLWVLHDDTLNGVTDYDGTKTIFQMTDAEIMECKCPRRQNDIEYFDDSELRIATLEEVIRICLKYGMKMYFRADDISDEYTEGSRLYKFVNLIKDYGIRTDEAAYSINSNSGRLNNLRQYLGDDIEISPFISTSTTAQEYIDWLDANNVKNRSIIAPLSAMQEADVKLLHRNNVKVYLYDASGFGLSRADLLSMASWGVDAIQSGNWYWLPY